jgi:hypothetical protein
MENDTIALNEGPLAGPRAGATRLKRLLVALLSAPFALGAVGCVVLYGYLRVASDRSLLSTGEWQRLRARLTRSAATEETSDSDSPISPSEPDPTPRIADAGSVTVAVEAHAHADTAPTPTRRSRVAFPSLDPELLALQRSEFESERPKSVMELQPFRRTFTLELPDGKGVATLTNVNPTINSWYLLTLRGTDGTEQTYHLANAHPTTQDLILDPSNPDGVMIVDSIERRACALWSEDAPLPLARARESRSPYLSLCNEEVSLRIPTPGRRTTLEWATDFLRDNLSSGESITVFVREKFFQDAFLETSELVRTDAADVVDEEDGARSPRPARMDPSYASTTLIPDELGISLEGVVDNQVSAGNWHPVRGQPGVYLSVVRPDLLDPVIFREHRDVVATLDDVEKEALVYLVAFDLSRFDVGFALGTEHPRVGWSERAIESVRDPSLPGPDGIGDIAPLVATGIVPRAEADRTIATFTGGFKRDHGAFRTSDLATRAHGSHYGFIESGAILSKLRPGLSTIFVSQDGRLEMKTWTDADDALVPGIRFARQNGVPLIERDPETSSSVPGPRVSQWAAGNWSGSQDRKFRTVRAGVALQTMDDRRYLIYAYFSSATPSAMARIFQSYGCEYAMMLDMNALEHTYMALYQVKNDVLDVQHMIRGMEVLDKTVEGQVIPRFIGFADNRDFFYLLRKEPAEETRETEL